MVTIKNTSGRASGQQIVGHMAQQPRVERTAQGLAVVGLSAQDAGRALLRVLPLASRIGRLGSLGGSSIFGHTGIIADGRSCRLAAPSLS